jgi:ribonuclease HI
MGAAMSDTALLRIHTDGASRGNPGAAAFAYVIERDDETLVEEAGCLGEMTNNQAEYTALVRALEHALELGTEHSLLIHSDSELLVKQMNGEYRVKNEELRDLFKQARELVGQFQGRVTIRHVRRGLNKRADELCNEALDGKRLPMPRASDFKPAAPKPAVAKPAPKPTLHEEALACLRLAGVEEPEAVWRQLADLLRNRGVRLPSEDGRT